MELKGYIKKWRVEVDSWTDDEIRAHSSITEAESANPSAYTDFLGQFTEAESLTIANDKLIPTSYLYQGAVLNLLLAEKQEDGRYLPQHIVLDPDYLVDVTAICHCFTYHGDAPAMHLLTKFMSSPSSPAIMLGNVANQFLDDCINAPDDADKEILYRQSLQKAFCSDPLRFATIEGIDQDFSNQCRSQFQNISSTVEADLPEKATLETAFLCEALGIQGRMDLLSADHRTVVELKSGKADESALSGNKKECKPSADLRFRYEHAMQMALYKEALYYNEGLRYAEVSTRLLYSRYPQLMDIHLGRNDIHRAMAVRNGIVHLEHLLCSNPSSLLEILCERHFNTAGVDDRFYENYLRPRILTFLKQLHCADPLARAYFETMTAFVEREQFLAKTGVEGRTLPVGHQGFADTWRASVQAKTDAGRLIPSLKLQGIFEGDLLVAFDATTEALDESSNFRVGDMVMLYPQDGATAQAASSYLSCIVEAIKANSLQLRLRYPQHDASMLASDNLFAIEPAHADSGYTTLYRGLFSLLTTTPRRAQLIMSGRKAEFDRSKVLARPVIDEHMNGLILRAKQAKDFFLLVGPPGTGKTSIALKQMVLEFLSDDQPQSLLLTAFTNRAVDEICTMLEGISVDYLRLGPSFACAEEHRKYLLSTKAEQVPSRKEVRKLLQMAPVIVGTIASISSASELFQLRHFDAAIVDEASQALEPHLMPLLCATDAQGLVAIDKFILIGDHKQLPAVVVQPESSSRVTDERLIAIGLTDCRRSLFERLHAKALEQNNLEAIGHLERQGRMHEEISSFVSERYYDGHLQPVPLPHQTACPTDIFGTRRLLLFDIVPDIQHCTAKSNADEAKVVAKIVAELYATTGSRRSIGIIVPFRGQIIMIRRALEALNVPDYDKINIDTVERYQGSQRDIIIFSSTISTRRQLDILSRPVVIPSDMPNGSDRLLDRKLNVAITRAREQFILVGNLSLLRNSLPYAEFIDYCLQK